MELDDYTKSILNGICDALQRPSRDQIAMAVIPALITRNWGSGIMAGDMPAVVAREAYKIADAVIAEREKSCRPSK
jgi:hypothetical protein